jgi:DNA-binding response OmpR family regulator
MTLIAVVDDDRALLSLMHDVLAEQQWEMVGFDDASTVVDDLRDAQPDAVIMDIRLGGLVSGWSVLHRLKADPRTSTLPVIVWSGDTRSVDSMRDWLDGHGILTLTKPFDIEDVYAALHAVLAAPERVHRTSA